MRNLLGKFASFGALFLCLLGSAGAAITDYPFKLVTRADGASQQVVAENSGPAPITVHVTLTGQNYASDQTWPLTATIEPFSSVALGRVYAGDNPDAPYNFLFRYSHHFGRVNAAQDEGAVYRLPFEEGHAFVVSQAHGGKLTSHNNRENLYAVDFAMPIGSAVTAARDGVVVDVTLRHREGGFSMSYIDKANTVAIVHDDGTVAEYAHLSPGAEIVKPGQRVHAGDLIGYSGNTGYSSGPHLHFIVSRPIVTDGKVTRESVPVMFYAGTAGTRFAAQAGTTVTANYRMIAPPDQQPVGVSASAAAGGTAQDR
ncbi:MAG TPA: M23 family metallopeptidase [Burkholderiales bacterium]|nr:M23 family metallopeptidase [Burkholderiales bacterium]